MQCCIGMKSHLAIIYGMHDVQCFGKYSRRKAIPHLIVVIYMQITRKCHEGHVLPIYARHYWEYIRDKWHLTLSSNTVFDHIIQNVPEKLLPRTLFLLFCWCFHASAEHFSIAGGHHLLYCLRRNSKRRANLFRLFKQCISFFFLNTYNKLCYLLNSWWY